ncbi:MAG: hypothetical protein Ct9H90mP22_5250 [Gammaproteobacteria bacterium]|nr:MAG: hypothetical protein Ct9H90mP22_5250 [Gammaproteobacteria bacterium]
MERDGEKIAFGTTRRNGASNDVWVMDYKYPEQAKWFLLHLMDSGPLRLVEGFKKNLIAKLYFCNFFQNFIVDTRLVRGTCTIRKTRQICTCIWVLEEDSFS